MDNLLNEIYYQDFEAFLNVNNSKIYNTLSLGAANACGMSFDKYCKILANYTFLKEKYDKKELKLR